MKDSSWKDCLESGSCQKISPDKEKAKSLFKELKNLAKERLND